GDGREGGAGGPHAPRRLVDASFAPACAERAHTRLSSNASESGASRPGAPTAEIGAGGAAGAQSAQRRAAGDQAGRGRIEPCAKGARANRAAANGRRSSESRQWRRGGAPTRRASHVLVLARKRAYFRRSAPAPDAGRRLVAQRDVSGA